MQSFSQVEKLINEYISFDWGKFQSENPSIEDITFQVILADKINEIAKEIFNSLASFIVSGNFLKEEIEDPRFTTLLDSLSLIRKLPETNYAQDQALLISSSIFRRWLRSFFAFYYDFNRRIKSPEVELSFAIYKEEQLDFTLLPLLKKQTNYLETIIRLYRYEIDLSTKDEKIRDLHIVKELFESSSYSNNDLTGLLIDKVDLLIKKIKRTNAKRNILYNIDFRPFSNDAKEHQIKHLSEFDIEFTDEYIKEQYRKISSKRTSESYREFFIEIKFFKEIGSIEQAKQTLERFEKQFSCQKNNFDSWAYGISYNYLFNNVFSLELNSIELSIPDIDKKIESIKVIQNQNGVRNYFPYKKLSLWLQNKIDKDLSNTTTSTDTNAFIDRYKTCLKIYRENIVWSKKHLIWSYQPRLEECIATSKDGISVFCASSFVLPINYDYEQECLKKFEESLSLFQSVYKTSQYLGAELKDINEAKKEVQGALRKNVEILSIFAAIVLFVSGNIQIFTRIDTLNSAIAFTLAYGYVVAVFILLISLIIRSDKEAKEFKTLKTRVLLFLGISTLIFYLTIIFAPNLPLSKDKETEKSTKTVIQQTISPQIQIDGSETKKK